MDFRNGYAVFEGRQRSLTEFIHFRIQRYGFLSIFFKIFLVFLCDVVAHFFCTMLGLCKDNMIVLTKKNKKEIYRL